FNSDSKYKLSAETIRDIASLKNEVKISVILEHSGLDALDIVKSDLERLLVEYIECNPLISITFINPARETRELRELSNKIGIFPSNVVIVQANERTKVLSIDELYEIHNGEVVGFCGERLLTSTINALLKDGKKNIYFTTGHGEFDIEDVSPTNGLSGLSTILRQKNFNVLQLDFTLVKTIPEDADLVIIVGPRASFLDHEVSSLKNYLDKRGGNLIVALSGSSDRLLNKFLLDHGICVTPNGGIFSLPGNSEFNDDLLVKKFAPNEITNGLIDLKLPVIFGRTCEVKSVEWEPEDFHVTELIQADGRCREQDGAFVVSALFEKDGQDIESLNGKMLVLGCADFLANSRINILGNKILLCRAVDFMCGARLDLAIHVIDIKKYRLSLSLSQYMTIMAFSILSCCAMFVLGFVVYIIRRK
ncbi:MAG: GldG family protein, partial [Opitutales bacterium]|nr:GldG family protein [Opitutales bacterium]